MLTLSPHTAFPKRYAPATPNLARVPHVLSLFHVIIIAFTLSLPPSVLHGKFLILYGKNLLQVHFLNEAFYPMLWRVVLPYSKNIFSAPRNLTNSPVTTPCLQGTCIWTGNRDRYLTNHVLHRRLVMKGKVEKL